MPFARAAELLKNWDDIYHRQVSFLNDIEASTRLGLDEASYLEDCRTIHMGAGRQNLRTVWMVKKLIEDKDSIVIVESSTHREFIKGSALAIEYGVVERLGTQVYTEYDLRSMMRTKSEKLDIVLRAAKRIFFDRANRTPVLKITKLIAPFVHHDVILVAVH